MYAIWPRYAFRIMGNVKKNYDRPKVPFVFCNRWPPYDELTNHSNVSWRMYVTTKDVRNITRTRILDLGRQLKNRGSQNYLSCMGTDISLWRNRMRSYMAEPKESPAMIEKILSDKSHIGLIKTKLSWLTFHDSNRSHSYKLLTCEVSK